MIENIIEGYPKDFWKKNNFICVNTEYGDAWELAMNDGEFETFVIQFYVTDRSLHVWNMNRDTKYIDKNGISTDYDYVGPAVSLDKFDAIMKVCNITHKFEI